MTIDPAISRATKTYTVHSLSRGLAVLRAMRDADGPMRNQDVVATTGLPKATVSRLMHTLATMGYVRRIDQGSYVLGEASGRPGRAMVQTLGLGRFTALLRDATAEAGAFACMLARIAGCMVPVYRWSGGTGVLLASGVCGDIAADDWLTKACFEFSHDPARGNAMADAPEHQEIVGQLARAGWCHRWREDVGRLDACIGVRLQGGESFVLSLHVPQPELPSNARLARVGGCLRRAAAEMGRAVSETDRDGLLREPA